MASARTGILCSTCAKLFRTSLRLNVRCVTSYVNNVRYQSSEAALESPSPGGLQKSYPPHIEQIVESISKLNLLEVSSLNELLKDRLNIADAPMMPMGAMMAAPAAAEEEAAPVEEQTEFAVKLIKFDDGQKVKLIKEIKTVLPDMNLVQAKKFVESVPQVLKDNVSKDEATALKTKLEEIGATVEIE